MIFAYKKVMNLVRESPYLPESPETVKQKIRKTKVSEPNKQLILT